MQQQAAPAYSRTVTQRFASPEAAASCLAQAKADPAFIFGFVNNELQVEAFYNFAGEYVDIPRVTVRQESMDLVFG